MPKPTRPRQPQRHRPTPNRATDHIPVITSRLHKALQAYEPHYTIRDVHPVDLTVIVTITLQLWDEHQKGVA